MSLTTVSEVACAGGVQGVYSHASSACDCEMTFAVFLPPQAKARKVPVLWYLSGLTCTHENAMTKAALQLFAAEHGLAVVYPDTSPRGEGVPDNEAYDLGQGAGFYVDATRKPWAAHFQMYSYITEELPSLVARGFPVTEAWGITGHSMGGHGALTIAMRNPGKFRSVSAFAPICNPTGSDWGRKQLKAYLGPDESKWAAHDATLLLREVGWSHDILIDQGADDPFYELLKPELIAQAFTGTKTPATLRVHAGYDHGYHFVSSFAKDHVAWHAERLNETL